MDLMCVLKLTVGDFLCHFSVIVCLWLLMLRLTEGDDDGGGFVHSK